MTPRRHLRRTGGATTRLERAVRSKSTELAGHLDRMARLCARLGSAHGLSAGDTHLLCSAAPLHDVGKIAVPDEILNKPGSLTPDEWEIMRLHTVFGAEMLSGSSSPVLRAAREIALCHHERWDGSGYPNRLAGDAIPMFARIVALVDQYDALRSRRPYKPALSHLETCSILLEGDDRTRPEHFDPDLLTTFESIRADFDVIFDELGTPAAAADCLTARRGLPYLFDRGRGLVKKLPVISEPGWQPVLRWASLCV